MKNTAGPLTTHITVRIRPEQLKAVDQWRADHPNVKGLTPDRSTVVRAALDAYLNQPNADQISEFFSMLRQEGFEGEST